MPLLWRDSVDAHRHAVRESVLDAVGAIYTDAGPTGLTMSAVAERAGIGRGTLYRYFADTRELLLAWHERQVRSHLEHLRHVRAHSTDSDHALRAVLEAYASLSSAHSEEPATAGLHFEGYVAEAQHELHALLRDLLGEESRRGRVRVDVDVDVLAIYCVHALGAARQATAPDARRVITDLVMDALRPRAAGS
ncbi:TetR/AcrR family transcriptional regulator [Cellulomonas sp. 179-A 4D5 NHS]|uniref:TetR/AcrR family transcriptional regulator n=1 Tax=Cellulomonas sp. 179-A 4D5 NHS TaxID=3142378 RepID=UPI00399EF494